MQDKIYSCYVPKILKKTISDDCYGKNLTITNIMELSDAINGTDPVSLFSRRLLVYLLVEAVSKDEPCTHIHMTFLNYETEDSRFFPFVGEDVLPYLVVDNKETLSDREYASLASVREELNFKIIDSEEFKNILLKTVCWFFCTKKGSNRS